MIPSLANNFRVKFLLALITLAGSACTTCALRSQLVKNCMQLEAALASSDPVEKIIVNGNVRCSKASWLRRVTITKNILIVGKESNQAGMASIDWTDSSQVIVIGRDVMVTFQNLVLMQDFLGISGLNVAFMNAEEGAEVTFKDVAFGVRSCQEAIGRYDAVLENLPRPALVEGSQKAQEIDSRGLKIVDVAFTHSTSKSLWRMCNTFFVCLVQSPLDTLFSRLLIEKATERTCPGADFEERISLATEGAPQRKIEQPGDSNNYWLAALTAASFLVLVVLTGLVFYKFIYPQIRRKRRGRGVTTEATSSVEKDEEQGDIITNKVSPGSPVKTIPGLQMKLTDIELGAPLGRGGYGIVYQGYYKGIPVAIKVIDHEKGKILSESGVPLEAYLSQRMYHGNIVQTFLYQTHRIGDLDSFKFQGSVTGKEMDTQMSNQIMTSHMSTEGDIFSNIAADTMKVEEYSSYRTFLVLEFCDAGPLSKAIREGMFLYQEPHWRPRIMDMLLATMDVAKAMSYLHSKRIIHGDLKPENILLKTDASDSRGYVCKVGDFGLSRFLSTNTHIETFTLGTVAHMPPEMLKNGILTPAADVYSFGMLFWRIMSGQIPFRHMGHNEIMVAVVSGRRPDIHEQFPIECSRLIQDCWQQNYKARPSFIEIVERLADMMNQVAQVVQAPKARTKQSAVDAGTVGVSSDDGFTSECSGLVSDANLIGKDKGPKATQTPTLPPLHNPTWVQEQIFLPQMPCAEDSDAVSETHKHKRWDSGQSVDVDAFGSTTDLEVIEESARDVRTAGSPFDKQSA